MSISVQVRDLCKVFGSGSGASSAVTQLTFGMESGEVLALLGPNGAGKTTTVKMMCGLITPSSGTIHIGGLDVTRQPRSVSATVSAVLEGSRNVYWRLTVAENLEYFATIRGRGGPGLHRRIDRVLETLDLTARRQQICQTLSRGLLQRVALASALISEPEVLFLDEPTLGLDYESAQQVKGAISTLVKQEGKSVLLTTHQLDLAQALASRVGIMSQGRLVALDTVEELRRLFGMGQYEICVRGMVSTSLLTALAPWRPQVEERDGNTVMALIIHDPKHLYLVLDAIRPTPILSLRETKPDLERIYVETLRKEG